MIVLELFAGTRSIGKVFEKYEHQVYSVEWDKKFENIDLYKDIEKLTVKDIIKLCGRIPDVVWASPDCTTYSIAGIGHHRKKVNSILQPTSEYANKCDRVNRHLLDLIQELKPKLYFIENPRGGLRKMDFMRGLYRYTVTYCQYGDFRMKPTDIWTNHPYPMFKEPCKNGDGCHEAAPRHSNTGTQRLRSHVDRSKIPQELCEHIVRICEVYINGRTNKKAS